MPTHDLRTNRGALEACLAFAEASLAARRAQGLAGPLQEALDRLDAGHHEIQVAFAMADDEAVRLLAPSVCALAWRLEGLLGFPPG